jgi:hypothetical protein
MSLRGVKPFSWLLAAVMLWLYGGGRVHAENYVNYANRAVVVADLDSRFDDLLGPQRPAGP